MKTKVDLDFDALARAGVAVLQRPAPWMLVYAGKELGVVAVGAAERDAPRRLQERVRALEALGKKILISVPHDLGDGGVLYHVYFYQ